MTAPHRSILTTLIRCLRLSCPVCGQASIIEGPFQTRHHCPACHALFKREQGFFVGAILANVVTTEIVIMLAYVLCLLAGAGNDLMLGLLFGVGVLFPILFYHHSWSFWLGFDYLVESLPKYVEDPEPR